jgi:hypothetical protein
MSAAMTMRCSQALAIAAVFGMTGLSCGDVVRDGRSPVYLVIDTLGAARGGPTDAEFTGTLLSDVITNVTEPEPCSEDAPCPTIFNDTGEVTLRLVPKSLDTGTAPSLNNEVTITRYRVTYRRADGRNTQGVDVPYAFDGAVTGTVPAEGTLTLVFELVRHAAKAEPPLRQLAFTFSSIATITDVTFYGRDRVGNEISVTGSILIEFGNFGDES